MSACKAYICRFTFFLYYASVILQILKTMAVQILPHLFFGFFFIAGKRLHIYYSFLNIPKRKNKPLLTFYSVNEWHIKMFCFRFHSAFFFLFHVKKYQSVVLTLDDINDESPVFDYPSYQILIPEVHLPLIDFAYWFNKWFNWYSCIVKLGGNA